MTTDRLAGVSCMPATESGQQLLSLLLPYLHANGITAGSPREARHAASIDIVGGEKQVIADEEQAIRDGGSVVTRLPADPFELAEALEL